MYKSKDEVLKDIAELVFLDNNWDGYGALPILPICIRNAKNLFDDGLDYSKIKDIYGNSNGTVSIYFENCKNENCLGLKIGLEEMSYYIDYNKDTTIYANHSIFSKESEIKLINYVKNL